MVSDIPPEVCPIVTRAAFGLGVIRENEKHDPMSLLRMIHVRNPELADLLDEYAVCFTRWYHERCYKEGSRVEVELRDKRDALLQTLERRLSVYPAPKPKREPWLQSWIEEKALQLIERRLATFALQQPPSRKKQDRKRGPSWWPFARR